MADEKPDVKNEPITLKVKDGAGLETIFKVKRTTKFGKIFDAYANKTGQQAAGLRFLFDGNTLDKVSLHAAGNHAACALSLPLQLCPSIPSALLYF